MYSRISVVVLMFLLLTCVAQTVAAAEPATIRPAQLRGFAVESETSVVVREGHDRFRRVVLAVSCPELTQTRSLDFQIGAGVFADLDESASPVPVIRSLAPPQVSSDTRQLHLLVGRPGVLRTACAVARIEAASRAAFDDAGVPPSAREDRREAAGQ
jgi:hypothetical protein